MKLLNKMNSKEKQELYIKLGAHKWQQVVFKVEEIKYSICKKIPNLKEKIDKLIDFRYKTKLNKAKTIEEKKQIEALIRHDKLLSRRELVLEENRNYHFDPLHPEDFIHYLKYNKGVHLKGMGINIGSLAALGVSTFFIPTNLIPVIILLSTLQVAGLYINFECVNLQNYNLERFNNDGMMKLLKSRASKKTQTESEEYKNATNKVSKVLEESSSIPNISEVISSLETEEEKQEFRKMLIKQKSKLKEKRR